MISDRERRAHEVFTASLDLEGDARKTFISAECADDDALRTAVERLVRAVGESTDFLEGPAIAAPTPGADEPTERDVPADAIEGLRIIGRLGAGGMAAVYEAEQDTPRRRVAVKVLHAALTGTSAWARFMLEADLLARLNHPGVAQIHGSGACVDAFGQQVPYFIMEYIPDARTICAYAREERLGLRARLQLFAAVCDAVQYGHQLGVIHRDLKPGNILVGADGRPRVIDFGVARLAAPGADRLTLSREYGQLVGTLNYMSPEQCAGDGRVDTRTDVYSLGVVLYELVTDARPYDLSSSSILDAVQAVQHQSPIRADVRAPGLPAELSAVVMKALEKEPQRRYASVSEFAADVRRYLDDRPVIARPASTAYQVRMFIRRNRALAFAVAGVAAALVIGSTVALRMAFIADRARDVALENERITEQVATFQEGQLGAVNVALMGERLKAALLAAGGTAGQDEAALEAALAEINFTTIALDSLNENILTPSREAIETQFAADPVVRARLLHALGSTMADLGRPTDAEAVFREAMTLRLDELGPAHFDTMNTMRRLGYLLTSLAEEKRAEGVALLEEVVETCRDEYGPDDQHTLSAMTSLGGAYRRVGRYEEAEAVWREGLEGQQRTLGPDHDDTLRTLNNVGVVLAIRGEYGAAEETWRELADRRREKLGAESPEYRASLSNLGLLLMEKGDFEGARPLLEQSLAALREIKGDDHPSTLNTMGSVAALRLKLEDFDGARALFYESLEGRKRRLGPTSPETLRSLASVAQLEYDLGRYEDAERLSREAVVTQRAVLGDDHLDLIQSESFLAVILHALERFEESETLHLRSIDRARRRLAPVHLITATSLKRYGMALVDAGRPEDAAATLEEAYDMMVALTGPEDRTARVIAAEMTVLYEEGLSETSGAMESATMWRARALNPGQADASESGAESR